MTSAPAVSAADWEARFAQLKALKSTYYHLVVLSASNPDRLIASGVVFMEHKFLRNLGIVGHIEDIIVHPDAQGKGLGKVMIQALTLLSEGLGAYKTILDCSDENKGEPTLDLLCSTAECWCMQVSMRSAGMWSFLLLPCVLLTLDR